jgi:S-ribosylhomocysteine lyase LuxS involved in autoinducer biosynthesis
MQTKVTLDVEDDLIQQIKVYAHERNKSISQIVTDYFQELARQNKNNPIPPVTQSLIGILQNHHINEDDYKQHLKDKYL